MLAAAALFIFPVLFLSTGNSKLLPSIQEEIKENNAIA